MRYIALAVGSVLATLSGVSLWQVFGGPVAGFDIFSDYLVIKLRNLVR